LTFGVVEIGRHSYGAGVAAQSGLRLAGVAHRVSVGIDVQSQNDLRRNYATCADTIPLPAPTPSCPDVSSERGIVTLDQRELISSAGAYVSDEVRLSNKVSATVGARADNVRFRLRDRLITSSNPDDSGRRSLASVSPLAGIVARVAPLASVYANVSTAFETPTTTELGNQPDGSAGINQDLDPQKSVTLELGAKGFAGNIRYDAAVYTTSVRDELVPFEVPSSDGRRFFRNAGRTSRRGAEFGADVSRGPVLVMVAYNYSRFRFEEFDDGESDFGGNRIPGIPRHRGQAAVVLSAARAFAVVEGEAAGESFTDDANTFRAPGYGVVNVRGGINPLRSSTRLSITMGIQNVFDRAYASSIAVNAARDRFFEPGAPRSLFVGVTLGGELRPRTGSSNR
jgi:iron complex outermembrane receptor protein